MDLQAVYNAGWCAGSNDKYLGLHAWERAECPEYYEDNRQEWLRGYNAGWIAALEEEAA